MLNRRKNLITLILSIIYSTCIIIGYSFMLTNSFKWIDKHLFINIVLYIILVSIIYIILNKIFTILDNKKTNIIKFNKIKKLKLYNRFNKRTFLFSLIFMIICWLPYIISFYPAILSPDPSF